MDLNNMHAHKTSSGARRGYLYTVGVILLMIPLILLIVFYTGVSKTGIENTVANIRCDELYYFVQDIESDMERAMLISGRRAAIYAIDDVVTNGRPMENYTYTNCTDFVYPRDGSEAAIAELVLCGTLNGTEVKYMANHTLPVWLDKINNGSKGLHYVVNLSIKELTIAMSDAWDFAITLGANITVHDDTGLCYYIGQNFTLQSFTDITGLEDTLYPLHTSNRVRKYIYNCPLNITLDNVAGCSDDLGVDIGAGNVVFYSKIPTYPDLGEYCEDYDVSDKVIVFDIAGGSCHDPKDQDCFNISKDNSFAAYINYASGDITGCDITIPWIEDTGKLDNETTGGHSNQRDPDCADANISSDLCVLVKNVPSCDIHQVLIGYNASNLNTTCYVVSNITGYRPGCSGKEYPNGPSFFDRLDGRLYLSDYYKNHSVELFGNPYIGIETLVNPYDLDVRGVDVFTNATWVDYLYWNNTPGSPVNMMCQDGIYLFRLDCPHSYFYRLGTVDEPSSSESPESTITSAPNSTACLPVSITGNATDCDGDINYVQLLINGIAYDTTWDGSEWNKTFSPSENDIYFLQSRAVDNSLVYEENPEEVAIFVSGCAGGDNNPPSVPSLNGPCGESGLPTTVTLDWDAASDSSGIYRYDIELNKTSSPPTSDSYYSFTTTYPLTGLSNNKDYVWRVRAQDNAGNWGNWSNTCTFST